MDSATLGIGVIGAGHWGPNHIRNFNAIAGCAVRVVSDLSTDRLNAIQSQFRGIRVTSNAQDVLDADDVQAVIVATPTATHHAIAKQALARGKHVLCEKPLTLKAAESQELVDLAESKKLVLMVGHVFLWNPGILYLKQQIDSGSLGRVLNIDATRTNLGPIRRDVGAIYDLASHDISIFNFLLQSQPREASAHVSYCLGGEREDLAYVTLEYPGNVLCHAHVSWLNPRKVRQITVVGDKRMAVWDDMQTLEPIRLYDKGLAEKPHYDSFGQFQMILRDADITIPKVNMFEPLMRQAQHFVECVRQNKTPVADGRNGLAVVRALEACMESARRGGRMVPVEGDGAPGGAA